MANRLDLGKSYVDTEKFFARVTGGGAYGPAELAIFDGTGWRDLEIFEDMRSGSERSRYVTYDTSRHGLYKFVRAAVSAGRVENGYFEHTEDGQIVRLSDAAVEKRQIQLFPEYETILQVAREKELRQAEDWLEKGARYQQKITERKAMAETARATLKSQGVVLPKLVGKSTKQVKFANDVRARIALSNPTLPELQTQTSAEFWIERRNGDTAFFGSVAGRIQRLI